MDALDVGIIDGRMWQLNTQPMQARILQRPNNMTRSEQLPPPWQVVAPSMVWIGKDG
jgi:hypothetical protein